MIFKTKKLFNLFFLTLVTMATFSVQDTNETILVNLNEQIPTQQDQEVMRIISSDEHEFIIPKAIPYFSNTIKSMHQDMQGIINDTNTITFHYINGKTFERLLKCLATIHRQTILQKQGQISTKDYIIGDNILVASSHIVPANALKLLKPILLPLTLEEQQNIIFSAQFLGIPWLVNAAISLWIDEYSNENKLTIKKLTTEKFLNIIHNYFNEDLDTYFRKQLRLKQSIQDDEFTIADYALFNHIGPELFENGQLILNNKELTSIDDYEKIIGWENLTEKVVELKLNGNFLTTFDFLQKFEALESLELSNNNLKEFPELTNCSHLVSLNLSGNRIKKLTSDESIQLKLEYLFLQHNKIEEISLNNCPHLVALELVDNRLKTLITAPGTLEKLEYFNKDKQNYSRKKNRKKENNFINKIKKSVVETISKLFSFARRQ